METLTFIGQVLGFFALVGAGVGIAMSIGVIILELVMGWLD